jgi:hypothetical protein
MPPESGPAPKTGEAEMEIFFEQKICGFWASRAPQALAASDSTYSAQMMCEKHFFYFSRSFSVISAGLGRLTAALGSVSG